MKCIGQLFHNGVLTKSYKPSNKKLSDGMKSNQLCIKRMLHLAPHMFEKYIEDQTNSSCPLCDVDVLTHVAWSSELWYGTSAMHANIWMNFINLLNKCTSFLDHRDNQGKNILHVLLQAPPWRYYSNRMLEALTIVQCKSDYIWCLVERDNTGSSILDTIGESRLGESCGYLRYMLIVGNDISRQYDSAKATIYNACREPLISVLGVKDCVELICQFLFSFSM